MQKQNDLSKLIESIQDYPEALQSIQETIITNAIMAGEIPAPTFGEEQRVRFLSDRFTEAGLQNISIDEKNNCVGIIPGKNPDKNILLVAHSDTVFDEKVDHAMSALQDTLIGAGIADNSLGFSMLASDAEHCGKTRSGVRWQYCLARNQPLFG